MYRKLAIIIALIGIFTIQAFAQDKAPDFTLKDLSGKKVKISDQLANGPVVIDFWAMWCKPCKESLPHLNELYKTFNERGVQVYAVSTDNPKSQSKIKPFIKSGKYEFEVLLDPNNEYRKLFGGTAIPFTVVIAQDGTIAYQHLGYVPGDEKKLTEMVEKLLIEKSVGETSE